MKRKLTKLNFRKRIIVPIAIKMTNGKQVTKPISCLKINYSRISSSNQKGCIMYVSITPSIAKILRFYIKFNSDINEKNFISTYYLQKKIFYLSK